jgi:DNA-binding transcriptional MerR regulator
VNDLHDNELLSIQQFSKLTGIKGSTLRYYDDLGLFSPADRGDNNYRYYKPQQLITINAIELLHDLDMPIKQICEIEKYRSPQTVLNALLKKEQELQNQLLYMQKSYDVIKTLTGLIKEGLNINENEIYQISLDEMPMIIGPDNEFKGSDNFYDAFVNFCAEANSYNIDLRYPVGGLYESMEAYTEWPQRPAQFFSYNPNGSDVREAGNYLVAYARGYYGQMGNVKDRILAYAEEHGLNFIGPVTVVYIHDEICIKEHDRYLAEIQVRVEKSFNDSK